MITYKSKIVIEKIKSLQFNIEQREFIYMLLDVLGDEKKNSETKYEQGKKDEIDLTIKEYNKWDNSKSKTWFQDYLNKRKKELAEK